MKLPSKLPAALTLGAFALLSLGWVGLVHWVTEDRIDAMQRKLWLDSFQQLMPAEAYDNDPLQERIAVCSPLLGGPGPQDLYLVRKSGQPVAMALNVTAPDGYAGAIELLVVVRTDGSLAGVRVQEHRETPGLGDLIEIGKSGWIEKFKDLSLVYPTPARWKLKRYGGHFDQFAGATITPAAVVEAVRKSLWFFRDQGKELLTTQNEAMPCDGSCREATCPK